MKKEYVKPQNRVVVIKDQLLQVIGAGSDDTNYSKGIQIEDDTDNTGDSSDVWED